MRKNKLARFDKEKPSPTMRQRKAAYKAWKTIRTNNRILSGTKSEKIDRFWSTSQLSTVVHPEVMNDKQKGEETTSYGRGIVSLFHKTPSDIACGRFWEVRWAYGCPLDCSYCYLRGTMRGKMEPSPLKPEHVVRALDEAFEHIKEPSIFNAGELSDSLMYPSMMRIIVDRFEQQDKHKIILLSKMGAKNIDFLLEKHRKQTICAWSINAVEVARRWERAAPAPDQRISAARRIREIGYDTRIRIDPIFPIDNWRIHYEDLFYRLLSEMEPTRIVLGTPRGLWKTIKYAQDAKIDMSWSNYFKEDSGWGKKLDSETRKQIYIFAIDKLTSLGYAKNQISICKETTQLLDELGMKYSPLTCNCYGKTALEL